MSRFTSHDRATIPAPPERCFAALVDELDGHAVWWAPYLLVTPRQSNGAARPGAEFDVIVSGSGHPDRPIGTARWAWRTLEVLPGHVYAMEYIEGAFRGVLRWTFEPSADGQTELMVDFDAEDAGSMKVLSHLVSVPKTHTTVMRAAFEGMTRHVRAAAAAA